MGKIGYMELLTRADEARVRSITDKDLRWALSEGWSDFNEKRGDFVLIALIYPIVAALTAAVSFNSRLLPVFFPAVAGLSILGPAVASGFYELARRRELGLEAGWRHFLDPIRDKRVAGVAILTVGLTGLFVLWMAAAYTIYRLTMGADQLTATEFLTRLYSTQGGWVMIILGNLVGFLFAVATLVLALVSFPMMVDKNVSPVVAVSTSIRAVVMNQAVVAQWGLWVALLLVLGSLPAFVGLAVVLPVLGYASWHLYTRIVVR